MVSLNKEAKKLTKPTGKKVKNYLGIQQLKEKQEAFLKKEKVTNDHSDLEVKEFSADQLIMAWKKFAHKSKEEGINTLYTAMQGADPKIGADFLIEFTVKNPTQHDFIKTHETQLLEFLRNELRNFKIKLNLVQHENEKKIVFTSKDKFNKMAEENPDLQLLRQRFKLDYDL